MDYPREFVEYLVLFHGDRDFFECHEVMEAYWKKTAGTPFAKCWLALIQLAVSAYHERRGNTAGALKMAEKAMDNANGEDWSALGLDGPSFLGLLESRIRKLQERPFDDYEDPNLPLEDPMLIQACMAEAVCRGVNWQAPSDPANADVVHKHLRRDRTEVIELRKRNWEARRLARDIRVEDER
jgi:predicted metal-dependent hydrolase